MGTADFVEAEIDLQRARSEEPSNKDVAALMQKLKLVRKQTEAKTAQFFGNMFKHVAPLSELEARKAAKKSKMEAAAKEEEGGEGMEVDETEDKP